MPCIHKLLLFFLFKIKYALFHFFTLCFSFEFNLTDHLMALDAEVFKNLSF